MTNKIKISVLMPVYNVENYLRQSIDSVISQTYEKWELIIVDDGSSDDSGRICDEYAAKEERIKVIHKSNAGSLSARRDGIKAARGDYGIFLDSDDFLEADCMERIVSEIEKTSADIIIYRGYIYNAGEQTPMYCTLQAGVIDKKIIYKTILSSDEINAIWTKAIRMELLQEDPTDYSVFYSNSYGEDKLQFLYPVTHAKTIDILPVPLINYRQVESSLIHNVKIEMIAKKLQLEVWEKIIEYAEIWDLDNHDDILNLSTYCLRHLINTYTNVFYGCKDADEVKACVTFPWEKYLPSIVYEHRFRNNLSLKEKIKLYCILHQIDIFMRIKTGKR